MLLRIPGLGVRTVDRILKARRFHRISARDLQKLHVPWSRAKHFVSTSDHSPRSRDLESLTLVRRLHRKRPRQLTLFQET
jgi:predicted DNA-binding helix-hairpin-helix protein